MTPNEIAEIVDNFDRVNRAIIKGFIAMAIDDVLESLDLALLNQTPTVRDDVMATIQDYVNHEYDWLES